jgi:hypothetical protein
MPAQSTRAKFVNEDDSNRRRSRRGVLDGDSTSLRLLYPMKIWHTLIISPRHETPAIVHDAKIAGFELAYADRNAFGGKPKERKWFIYATEDEFLRFMESGQP